MSKKQFYPVAFISLLCATASISKADLIAYWPLDEGEGDIAHDIVSGFDGQIAPGGTWYTPGKMGAFAYEAAGGNEINCGTEPSPTSQDLTLAWWMIDNHASYGTIMDKSVTGSGYGYNILVRPSNEDSPLRFRIGGWQSYGGWNEECRLPLGAYNEGEWVHIVCTYDSAADTASIYVNGELPDNGIYNPKTGIAGPGGYCDGVNNVETPLYIRGGEESFNGVLDEVAIWDQALTANEVMTVYKLGPTGLAAKPLALDIESDGSDLTFAWESQASMLYNLRSVVDPSSTDPKDWPIYGGNMDLTPTPPTNTLTIPLPPEAMRLFVIEEFPAPPVTVFSDNFEDGPGDWTSGGDPGSDPFTNWEFGSPTVVGPTSANSGANCFGTNLSADYTNNSELWLRSPPIDLTAAAGATLNFSHYVDIEEGFDFGQIRLLDADAANAELAILEMTIDGNNLTGWEQFSKALPAAALGMNVVLEFRFGSDDISDPTQAGWYIDDVEVTTPAP